MWIVARSSVWTAVPMAAAFSFFRSAVLIEVTASATAASTNSGSLAPDRERSSGLVGQTSPGSTRRRFCEF